MRFRVKGLNIKAEGKRRWYGSTCFGYYRHTLHKHKAHELSATPLICLNVGLLRFKLCDFSRLFPFACHNPFAIIPRLYNSVWQMLNKSVFLIQPLRNVLLCATFCLFSSVCTLLYLKGLAIQQKIIVIFSTRQTRRERRFPTRQAKSSIRINLSIRKCA